MRWIKCNSGFELGVREGNGLVQLCTAPGRRDPVLTPAEAREVALELTALAERIDPQPPPRDRRAAPAERRCGDGRRR